MLVRGTNEGCLMTLYLVRQTWLLSGTNEGSLMTLYHVRQTWLLRGTNDGCLMTISRQTDMVVKGNKRRLFNDYISSDRHGC